MKELRCRTCSNIKKGKDGKEKISNTLKQFWNDMDENEKIIRLKHLRTSDVVKKGVKTRKNLYNNGKIRIWNKGLHVQTNSGRTHIKKGEHISPETEFKRGQEHIYWKTDRESLMTPLRKSIRSCKNYIDWRKSVFERDNYTCKICNNKGYTLNAHHIKSFEFIIKDNNINDLTDAIKCDELWNINNGITLCKECHKWIHSINPLYMQ